MSATSFQPYSDQPYSEQELSELVNIARKAIEDYFNDCREMPQPNLYDARLLEPAACFVTLEVAGQLQGCLGCIEASQPLIYEVYNKACSAAYQDHRFLPLEQSQLDDLTVEVSVLTPPQKLIVNSEPELEEYLQNNRGGVILSDASHRALFLPQVWEQLRTPKEFLHHLKIKGGWSSTYWSPSVRVDTFTVISKKQKYRS